jgi:hypothetical protein
MLLAIAPATLGTGMPLPEREFVLTAIRSALFDRHPELLGTLSEHHAKPNFAILESNLEALLAMAEHQLIIAPSTEVGNLLDEHVCPGCSYNPPAGDCPMRSADESAPEQSCVLRRYGPTIMCAAKAALLKLAGAPQAR